MSVKYYNLENHTGEVTLDELFQIRNYFEDAVNNLQTELDSEANYSSSIEGDGFNIRFLVNEKEFFLRCELIPITGRS